MAGEPAMDGIRQPAAPDGPLDRAITSGLGLLSLVALVAMAAGLPYQIRLWILVLALAFGPSTLVARIVVGRYMLMTFLIAAGVGIAGLMVFGQAMVVAHVWIPVAAAYITLVIGLAAALWLLRERWLPSSRMTGVETRDPKEQTEDAGV